MNDYSLKLTIRNARILRAIKDAGYKNQSEFARANGLSKNQVNALVAMRTVVVTKAGRLSKIAQDVVDALCVLPEELWTDKQLFLNMDHNTIATEISESEALNLAQYDAEKIVNKLMVESKLSSREKTVLLERSKGRSLSDIADSCHLTTERIRQIEAKALRHLRGVSFRSGLTDEVGVGKPPHQTFLPERETVKDVLPTEGLLYNRSLRDLYYEVTPYDENYQ